MRLLLFHRSIPTRCGMSESKAVHASAASLFAKALRYAAHQGGLGVAVSYIPSKQHDFDLNACTVEMSEEDGGTKKLKIEYCKTRLPRDSTLEATTVTNADLGAQRLLSRSELEKP